MRLLLELALFAVIGIIGLLVDIAVLYAFKSSLGPFLARGLSFSAAVITTWLLNRKITFGHRDSQLPKYKELLSYCGLMLVGGIVNYVCYTWLVLTYKYVEINLFIGVAAGSLAGMAVNFLTSRFFLFRQYSD